MFTSRNVSGHHHLSNTRSKCSQAITFQGISTWTEREQLPFDMKAILLATISEYLTCNLNDNHILMIFKFLSTLFLKVCAMSSSLNTINTLHVYRLLIAPSIIDNLIMVFSALSEVQNFIPCYVYQVGR